MTTALMLWPLPMHFPARLIQLRKAADLTRQGLADVAQLHVNQIRRYELILKHTAQRFATTDEAR